MFGLWCLLCKRSNLGLTSSWKQFSQKIQRQSKIKIQESERQSVHFIISQIEFKIKVLLYLVIFILKSLKKGRCIFFYFSFY